MGTNGNKLEDIIQSVLYVIANEYDEHQLLGNRVANLIFSFFCMVLFQSLLVEKLENRLFRFVFSRGTSAWVSRSPTTFFW